jgi:DNA-binding response OmpR family regulator
VSRILVVDETSTLRETFAFVLRRAGYDVACAAGIDQALSELERRPPDLILTDLVMAPSDGVELLRRVRGVTAWAKIPVLLLTAAVEDRELQAAKALRVQGHMLKSHFSIRELLERVQHLLRAAELHATAGDTSLRAHGGDNSR